MRTLTDQYGRTITVTVANDLNVYAIDGMSTAFPTSDPNADNRAINVFNGMLSGIASKDDKTQLAPFDFIGLFTDQEFTAIAASDDVGVKKAIIRMTLITSEIDLQNPETIQLVEYLQYQNLVTADRAQQILSGVAHG